MTQAPTTTTTTEVTDYYADPITVGSQVRRFTDYRRTLKVTRTNGTKVYTAWNGRVTKELPLRTLGPITRP